MSSMYKFFYHQESDSPLAIPESEIGAFMETADGSLCHEISLEEYLNKVDDHKQLPSDIKGILKNAYWSQDPFPKDILYGELWYNPQKQFPNGIGIYTSRINAVREDGVHYSLHAKYFVQFKNAKTTEKVSA